MSTCFEVLPSRATHIFNTFSYLPCLATMTLDTASGTLVPAAKNVIPITESGMFNVLPKNYEMIRRISTVKQSILLITSVFDFDLLFFVPKYQTIN